MTQVVCKNHFNRRGVYTVILLLYFLGSIACSPPKNHTEFSDPFELSTFLENHISKLPGQNVQFQLLSQKGEPIPYGLLKFQWTEGGRMSFQTDQDGVLSMQFEKDILDHEVMVSPESTEAKLRVTW